MLLAELAKKRKLQLDSVPNSLKSASYASNMLYPVECKGEVLVTFASNMPVFRRLEPGRLIKARFMSVRVDKNLRYSG